MSRKTDKKFARACPNRSLFILNHRQRQYKRAICDINFDYPYWNSDSSPRRAIQSTLGKFLFPFPGTFGSNSYPKSFRPLCIRQYQFGRDFDRPRRERATVRLKKRDALWAIKELIKRERAGVFTEAFRKGRCREINSSSALSFLTIWRHTGGKGNKPMTFLFYNPETKQYALRYKMGRRYRFVLGIKDEILFQVPEHLVESAFMAVEKFEKTGEFSWWEREEKLVNTRKEVKE